MCAYIKEKRKGVDYEPEIEAKRAHFVDQILTRVLDVDPSIVTPTTEATPIMAMDVVTEDDEWITDQDEDELIRQLCGVDANDSSN